MRIIFFAHGLGATNPQLTPLLSTPCMLSVKRKLDVITMFAVREDCVDDLICIWGSSKNPCLKIYKHGDA